MDLSQECNTHPQKKNNSMKLNFYFPQLIANCNRVSKQPADISMPEEDTSIYDTSKI